MKNLAAFVLFGAVMATIAEGAEIGFIENFALAENREEILKQLIPGTEDYYYYHCLHYQNTEQFDKVDELLKSWIKRHNYTGGVREIQHRQALLTYPRSPQKSLAFIREQLKLKFDHQRENLDEAPKLPTSLDANLISRETLAKRALSRYQNLKGFNDSALDWLLTQNLSADQRRHLLERLQRPDHPQLAEVVVKDLNYKNSKGFGAFTIHRNLLLTQLDECLQQKPALLNDSRFVATYVTKLQPNDDVDWRNDKDEFAAYLDRLWKFVGRLEPANNSLKAHVLYHRLALDRSRGTYSKQRFLAYIKLPRPLPYVRREFLRQAESRQYPANLGQDFKSLTGLPAVGNDEPLVREYLAHFFVKETNYKPYEPFIDDTYLRHLFAETKIVNGLGDAERWYSMLPPEKYQQLKDRVDIGLAPTNQAVFGAVDPVHLDLFVKNVENLIVKVYEINAANYYRQNRREVNTDINLDGLVANEETTHTYSEPPLRRVERHFEFPKLNQPGVYVIDFIGNGKSSRVVVRKGRLRYTARTSTLGHAFTIYDESHRKLPDASLWLGGREYQANEDGEIVVPFSNRPGRQPIVLSYGNRCSLHSFQHQSESYELVAGIHVDRESLLKHRTASVLVRPSLRLNGTPITLSRLEDVRLKLTSVDHDGVESTSEIADFKLFEDRESIHEFHVPARLSTIRFELTGRVEAFSRGKHDQLSASQQFTLNQIDKTQHIEDLHLLHDNEGYQLELSGKSGEAKSAKPVSIEIHHRDFRDAVPMTLQTDARGRIELGALDDISSVVASSPAGNQHRWNLDSDRRTQPQSVSGVAGQGIAIPYMKGKAQRFDVSLLELRNGAFVADRFDAMSLKDGFLNVQGLPRGDYELFLKESQQRIRLRLAEGAISGGYVRGEARQLEVRGDAPLQITRAEATDDAVTVRLANHTKFARVHVFAVRNYPAYSAYTNLSVVRDIDSIVMRSLALTSLYQEGRSIGDEYEYILRRQYAHKYPGNMLTRPSILLNPWAVRGTETTKQDAAEGEDFAPSEEAPTATAARGRGGERLAETGYQDFANLDFLASASTVLTNLEANDDGVLSIPRAELGTHQRIYVVAVDPVTTVVRSLSLPEPKIERNDLRLADGLDPSKHFTQQKQVRVLATGQTLELAEIGSSKFEQYDNLASIYRIFATLGDDKKLAEFNFILEWPSFDDAEKREKYSKYACHELNYFLYEKDKQFFESVVQPYLAHKRDKTFLDHWLLGDDLDVYFDPWRFAQLNVVERILLGQRVGEQRPSIQRHIRDLFELVPPDITRENFLFDTLVSGRALEADDRLGVREAIRKRAAEVHEKNAEALLGLAADSEDAAALIPEGAADDGVIAESAELAAPELAAKMPSAARRMGRTADYFKRFRGMDRAQMRQLYRALDKTKEWAENNYYHLLIGDQNADLVTATSFWNDFAKHDPTKPFFSAHWAEASRHFAEMMFALSVLDLPFESPEHKVEFDEGKMKLTAAGPLVAYFQEVRPVTDMAENSPVLASQNFFRDGDRYEHVNGQQRDKFVTEEFLVHTVYGCQIVVTNPTSTPQKLEILLEIPTGAIPVRNGRYRRSAHMDLQPYNTQTVEYYFYFPQAGDYQHFPVHVANDQQLLAHAAPFKFHVVDRLSQIDRDSWPYISQHGTSRDVLDFLKENNVQRIDLSRIAFRMQDKQFFQQAIEVLKQRRVYDHTLWSYAVRHDLSSPAREYLQHADGFVSQCGSYIDTQLLTIDPVLRKMYEHLEYKPLVNARAHQLGDRRQILNDRFHGQYHRLMNILGHRRNLDDDDRMSVTYYMLLQDRVDLAMHHFSRIRPDQLATRLQYDYLTAYLDCYSEEPQVAMNIVTKYADHPVPRWRHAFDGVHSLLDEVSGRPTKAVDPDDRDQQQAELASTEPSFQFDIEARRVRMDYQNLQSIQVNYYLMDLELLFSRNPFVKQVSGHFSHIRPNRTTTTDFVNRSGRHEFDLPGEFHNSNVLVEITAHGVTKTQAYYANSLNLQLTENYGQLRVTDAESGRPLSTVYVKAYARTKDGNISFYKDGYTDLRGRFDYTSLSTNELDNVQRFSLLVLSDSHGAIVREAAPPKQ